MFRIIVRLNAWVAGLLITIRKGKKVDWKQKLVDLTNILKKIVDLIPIKASDPKQTKRQRLFKRRKRG